MHKPVTSHIWDRLHERVGFCESPPCRAGNATYREMLRTEWCPEFETLMRNRLIQGAIRYGRLGAVGKPQYDRITSVRSKLDEYEETGNMEMLVDVANLMVAEYVEGEHPNKHFKCKHDCDHVEEVGDGDGKCK